MRNLAALITILIFTGFTSLAVSQEVTPAPKDSNIDQILTKLQANSLVKYQGIMTTILVNNPISKIYHYKIENYGNIFRREELLTNGFEKEIDYDDGKNLWRFFPNKNLLIKETTKINQPIANSFLKDLINLVKKNYEIKILGEYEYHQRIGYKVLFKPKIPDRPQQIYWIDYQTGIPLKIEKYGPDNELISVTSFSQIDFQLTPNKENLELMVPPQTQLTEVKEKFNLNLTEAKNQMENKIIEPLYLPAGFNLNNIIVRELGDEKIAQFFYTDGLSSLSIFQKCLKKETVTGEAVFFTSSGTLNIINLKYNLLSITIMGEVFKEEIFKVAESLMPDRKKIPQFPPIDSSLTKEVGTYHSK